MPVLPPRPPSAPLPQRPFPGRRLVQPLAGGWLGGVPAARRPAGPPARRPAPLPAPAPAVPPQAPGAARPLAPRAPHTAGLDQRARRDTTTRQARAQARDQEPAARCQLPAVTAGPNADLTNFLHRREEGLSFFEAPVRLAEGPPATTRTESRLNRRACCPATQAFTPTLGGVPDRIDYVRCPVMPV